MLVYYVYVWYVGHNERGFEHAFTNRDDATTFYDLIVRQSEVAYVKTMSVAYDD